MYTYRLTITFHEWTNHEQTCDSVISQIAEIAKTILKLAGIVARVEVEY